jgi:hypothetical protein
MVANLLVSDLQPHKRQELSTMIPDKMLEVLKKDGVVAIATLDKNGPGTGFLIRGTAAFISSDPDFDATKARFAWARAALAVSIDSVTQTL